jgi:Mrp family chromosome partitioning ATPase
MSRVYNMLTGTPRPTGTATIDPADDEVWANAEESPFVEIGGPAGPVFSAAQTPPPRTVPEVKIEAKTELIRSFPRLVAPPAPTYLSVKFHDVVAHAGLKSIGDGPDASLVAFHFPDHAVSGEYRILRDEIRKQLPDLTSRVLLFNAATPEAGTTTVILNLAITLAHQEKTRVLVVDANVTRPAIAAKLALKPAPGLCEVLQQQVPLAWAVQPSGIPGLHVLSAGDATEATRASVGRDFPRFLMQLRKWSDWVLVDAGVWGGMPERDAVCPSADAVYLVTREVDAERPEFLGVRGWVKELGGLLRGYVTTRV